MSRKEIIESLKIWVEIYKERWEMCKNDLADAYTEVERQIIRAQIQIYEDNMAEMKWIIAKAEGEGI